MNREKIGNFKTDRKAIFDIYCENEKGEIEIVKNFLSVLDDETISKTTGISIEEVKRLRLENKK